MHFVKNLSVLSVCGCLSLVDFHSVVRVCLCVDKVPSIHSSRSISHVSELNRRDRPDVEQHKSNATSLFLCVSFGARCGIWRRIIKTPPSNITLGCLPHSSTVCVCVALVVFENTRGCCFASLLLLPKRHMPFSSLILNKRISMTVPQFIYPFDSCVLHHLRSSRMKNEKK